MADEALPPEETEAEKAAQTATAGMI